MLLAEAAQLRHRSTDAVPPIGEYLGVTIDRRSAFAAGNIGALLDELLDAGHACQRTVVRNRPLSEKPGLGPGRGVWGGELPTDPVRLPAWAYEAAYSIEPRH
jgi:hypothetical protein